MNFRKKILLILFVVISSFTFLFAQTKIKTMYIVVDTNNSPRVQFGIEKLKSSLLNIGFETKIVNDINFYSASPLILITFRHNKKFAAGCRSFGKCINAVRFFLEDRYADDTDKRI